MSDNKQKQSVKVVVNNILDSGLVKIKTLKGKRYLVAGKKRKQIKSGAPTKEIIKVINAFLKKLSSKLAKEQKNIEPQAVQNYLIPLLQSSRQTADIFKSTVEPLKEKVAVINERTANIKRLEGEIKTLSNEIKHLRSVKPIRPAMVQQQKIEQGYPEDPIITEIATESNIPRAEILKLPDSDRKLLKTALKHKNDPITLPGPSGETRRKAIEKIQEIQKNIKDDFGEHASNYTFDILDKLKYQSLIKLRNELQDKYDRLDEEEKPKIIEESQAQIPIEDPIPEETPIEDIIPTSQEGSGAIEKLIKNAKTDEEVLVIFEDRISDVKTPLIKEYLKEIKRLDKLITNEGGKKLKMQDWNTLIRILHPTKQEGGSKQMLDTTEVNKLMELFDPNYVGAYPSDELYKISGPFQTRNEVSFIANTCPHTQVTNTHWCAVRMKHGLVEFFDPLGEKPTPEVMKQIRRLVKSCKYIHKEAPRYQFKVNRMIISDKKLQSDTSTNCGYFCVKFLKDRAAGVPWKVCTGYNILEKNLSKLKEADIEKFKKTLPDFGTL